MPTTSQIPGAITDTRASTEHPTTSGRCARCERWPWTCGHQGSAGS